MKKLILFFITALCAAPLWAQSTNQEFPTALVADEITARIAARDIGDARLTQHFYTFFGTTGDVVWQIETQNFDGDFDLFEAGSLRPLAKVTVFDTGAPQTISRTVYFRRREQVILRVEGRTLGDAAATYRFKFTGAFETAANLPAPPDDLTPKASQKLSEEAVARVSSSGAILEVLQPEKPAESEPKPTPAAKPAPEKESTAAKPPPRPRAPRRTSARRPVTPPKPATETEAETETPPAATKPAPRPAAKNPAPRRNPRPARPKPAAKKTETAEAENTNQPDPLASVRLVILLKNGDQIERPMSEVFTVSVDKGQITVINKNGKIERFKLLEVQKFSIEGQP